MELTRGDKTSELVGDFGGVAHLVTAQLEGRKTFKTPKRLIFESTEHNFRTLRTIFPEIAASVDTSPVQVLLPGDVVPLQFRLPPRDYQLASFHKLKALHAVALFSEPGTGKTKTIIDIICYRFLYFQLTGVLVLSSPKGVHAQWVEEQLPQHMWSLVPYEAIFRQGTKRKEFVSRPGQVLQIYSGNIDMLNSDKMYGILQTFCAAHQKKLMIVIDESASIKSWSAKRSKRLRMLATQYACRQRVIMTGTPIAKDLTDEWSQFYFLDPNIIGHKYKSSFMAQYCKMGGFENRNVIGYKNLEHFKSLTAPYIFRAHKSELNLPEKIYDHVEFDLSEMQRRLIREIKNTMLADLDDNGGRITATHAATALLRIHQISCGFAVNEDGARYGFSPNPRLEALDELASHISGKIVIWCRFQHDVITVAENFGLSAVRVYGDTKDADRLHAKQAFLSNPAVRYFVATPDTAGQGLDGLQTACENAIYYSNSYNAIARWQSEDRIHRLGMMGAASYYDLIARGSPDRAVLRNLRNKKTLSTLVLDDMKELIKELEP
jgi:superfamily II DNA or RNA helicase